MFHLGLFEIFVSSSLKQDYGIVYFDWNRGSTQFELLLSKDIIKDLVQALKLEHPAEHMQEGSHYLIT